ncbi:MULTISPECIES: YggS family pyridoxal phosphate-dependent enzyme [Clostridium]|uniref:Pyridoxal phosphate homeostasis protein n=1 Tax=Clostridium nitritogenes TaxID=83340 RepID=A0ABN1LKU0_9CLOT|nr:YggS family pyridoxal phosphate-dependent enzyme [Clostridium baratii]KJU71312.1 alanine racemase [Clostridium baratii]MBS6042700.1 YggS family pyridoxal phosphate-dependent enzyme [Clostridium baratii]MBT9832610.1 YggS family pyridoxal phosphate-dependent enzyme [Clostridium baratii]MDY3208268.1 YggS family pyridoxal phosphate-dependent enzyme [Clostridium baratii]STA99463.1 alanine racemase domain-containing protein [Clostridium baratii]
MSIKENIDNIVKELPDNVKLLAVSKTRSLEEMEEAYDYGLREFAENKVQELVHKEESFHKDVKWHLIGKLQTNKVKYIVGKVDLIHSLSSVKLLNKIEDLYSKKNLTANTLIQINIGREESKSGVLLEDLEELIENVENCNNVKVKGIMVIIPKGDEESNRNYFRKTHEIFSDLGKREFKNITMEVLSMGMTHDYKIAVEEGSNMVRVGTGIFGERNYNI